MTTAGRRAMGSTARRQMLLDRIRAQRGEWTVGRVKRLYARAFPDRHVLRSTIRRDLAALHANSHLVRTETPGRRFYTYDATGSAR